ncbi:hypothetical protein FIBSPDRAFT_1046695 [Athelia psychrophila]|uniref:F-box domain-containing protein n=1 Tax=Athelia psychrophila TaxID=1759441 RepID=A0A166GCF3_9AGAM|nr:hypothetical protein FIBSPDRAFT_1046695 [Fibularhizoctonia sp. CBS 109695]
MKAMVRAISRLNLRKTKGMPRSLPAELWTSIFETEVLEKCDILEIRLTCYTFATLAKPMAFRCLKLFPTDDYNYKGKKSKDSASRLAFWFSEDITPYIQEFSIYCTIDHPLTSLQVMFFGAISKCVNISTLRCEAVQFDDYAIKATSQLQKLQTIILFDCDLTLKDPPPTLKIKKVHFGSRATVRNPRPTRGRYGWLDILCPHAICELRLEFYQPGACSLRGIKSTTSPNAGDDTLSTRHLSLVISHPKALESLTISPSVYHPMLGDFQIPLPSLRTYRGIYSAMERKCFTLTERFQSLTLSGNHIQEGRNLCPDQLFGILPHPHALRQLCVNVAVLSSTLLDRICTDYPNIRVLSILSRNVDSKLDDAAGVGLEVLGSMIRLPANIEVLSLDVETFERYCSEAKIEKFTKAFREQLLRSYPTLRRVVLKYSPDIVREIYFRSALLVSGIA